MRSLRWRRHRGLVALTLLGSLVLVSGFGSSRIAAITSSERGQSTAYVSMDIQGLVDLFDDSVVHEIEITYDQDDYDRMIATFQEEGTKEYIEASVTIDGVTIEPVGIRLKGNSTLGGLGGVPPGGGPAGMPDQVQGDSAPENGGDAAATPAADALATPQAGTDTPDPVDAGPEDDAQFEAVVGGPGGSVSADDPNSLPWLLKFDEYVRGQLYQGYAEVAIRPNGMTGAGLNEPLTLNLVAAGGEPTEQSAYSSLTLNGGEPRLRLVVEAPGDEYALDNFETDGVLYKALSTGSFTYLGDDPLSYDDAFTQITRTNQQDLTPLIALLKFVAEADDAEFAARIGDYVDVESLANYIALQALLENFDDMGGPGQNYYLWYDLETELFTVLTWDMNLALAPMRGDGGAGPVLRTVGERPDGDNGTGGGPVENEAGGQMPAGGPPGEGGQGPRPMRGEDGDGGAGFVGGNPLKERFLAAAAYADLYDRAYAAMYDALYGDGQAAAELRRLSAIVAESGLVDAAALQEETATLQAAIDEKVAAGPVRNGT